MNHKRHPVVLFLLFSIFGVFMIFNLAACNRIPSETSAIGAEAFPKVSSVTLKELFPDTLGKGQPVVVDFYSQFCLGCQALSPKLEKAVNSAKGVTLTTLDIQKKDPDIQKISQTLGAVTAPYVLFIDGDGNIRAMLLEDVPQTEVDKAVQAIAPKN